MIGLLVDSTLRVVAISHAFESRELVFQLCGKYTRHLYETRTIDLGRTAKKVVIRASACQSLAMMSSHEDEG